MAGSHYDVIILGGAFSGSSAAVLLRRENPDLRVLVIEKAEAFDAKVGEATTEMSAMFLTRRLALWEHLEREHLPKEGLRFWFTNENVTCHAEASESGGYLRSSVPSFQLRRDVLDEHLLTLAREEGAEILRPARVRDAAVGEYQNEVVVDLDGESRTFTSRWLLDATGRATFLARRLGLLEKREDHPVAAVWARWKGVRHIDDIAARSKSDLARKNIGSRRLGTNHYMGRGSWIWVIPLGNGETSIGIVFDRRYVALHESRDREKDYVAFLEAVPALAELLEGAELRSEDLRFFSHLPYKSTKYMGPGWALMGDAAVFLDPFYSPGLDHAAFSIEATVNLVLAESRGEEGLTESIAEHNVTFDRSYDRFFEAVYQDKYVYMGEQDLLTAAFLMDTAQYYIFLVTPAYRFLGRFHWMPVLGPKPSRVSFRLMRAYNRRFVRIANLRHRMGREGRRNAGRRVNAYFNLGAAPFRMLGRGLWMWAVAEIHAIGLRIRSLFGAGRAEDRVASSKNAERNVAELRR